MIQESVDLIYFLEEDTIQSANVILDLVIIKEIKQVALESIAQCKEETQKISSIPDYPEDDDSLQVI